MTNLWQVPSDTNMRKVVLTTLIVLGAFLITILSYIIYQSIKLELWSGNKPSNVKELSKQQKIDDFKYLTQFVNKVYPYNDSIVQYMDMTDIESLEKEFIDRAGQSKNNSEFFELVYEYVQRLRQGSGHIDVYFGQNRPSNNSVWHSYVYNIKKSSYNKTEYWGHEASMLKCYAYSDAAVKYKNGQYILGQDYTNDNTLLPEGTIIKKVDGMRTDDYVQLLQNRTRLLYDVSLKKNFTTNLFSIDDNPDLSVWNVDFQLKNGTIYSAKLQKYNNIINNKGSINSPQNYPNVVCKELNESLGYIKIFSFSGQYIKSDKEIIQSFMQNSNGKYKKLIIDIRGNTGGEMNYWSDNLVQPLIREPKTYTQVSAVRKGFFNWMGIRYYAFRWLFNNDTLQKDLNHITSVTETTSKLLNNKDWKVYKITKRFVPTDSFPFNGKVYILTNQDTFSAADAFASAAKNMKLGMVIGTNTGGAGDVFMSPIDICLPNSQIIMRMDVELNFNDKGQPNHICGTIPDIELEPSSYPTEDPASLELNDLLKDTWINWVIEN